MSRSIFNYVQRPRLRRSVMDMSYQNSFTTRFGELVPVYFEDIIPTDKIRISAAPFVRMDPFTAPIMGQIDVNLYYFYVPYNIIWKQFEEFITGGQDGISMPVVPFFDKVSNQKIGPVFLNLLFDYFKMYRTYFKSSAPDVGLYYTGPRTSGLLWRAYWKIIDDYFRDQNLVNSFFDNSQSLYLSLDGGNIRQLSGYSDTIDGVNLMLPYFQAWKKDLFTSALPFAQRGAPVSIPIGDGQEVRFAVGDDGQLGVYTIDGGTEALAGVSKLNLKTDAAPGAVGRLTTATSVKSFNINDLREASAIQRFLEFNAIGGARYKEQVAMHFGANVKDYRLQRPEFLCGMKTPVLTSQVLQQSSTNSDSVLGTQGGYGIASGVMKPRTFFAEEHGCVIGLMSITPRSQYSQGVARQNLKFDKFDYFFPYFENLGEQAIYNAELYAQGNDDDLKEFGYAPRYYEYKHRENEVHGMFKDVMSYWLPQRIFSEKPALNSDFISINPDKEQSLNNIFAVQDGNQHQFQCVVHNSVRISRPMSKYSLFKFA